MARIYINCQVVASNQKTGEREPPITILRKGRGIAAPRLRWSAWLASSIRPTSR